MSAGTENQDGSVTLTPAQLIGLTVTPASNDSNDFTLSVTAISTDGADTAQTTASLPVTVSPVADTPSLNISAASGDEDSAIALDIAAALSDASEVLSITVSDIPAGAVLSAGTENQDGSVTLTPAQLTGLTVTPALNDSNDFTLSVTATSTDGADSATTSAVLTVTVLDSAPLVSGLTARSAQVAPTLVVHGLSTDTPFIELQELSSVSVDSINGVEPTDLLLANDHPVSVTFMNETAGFQNTIGFYKIAEDGGIADVTIIFENASRIGSGGNLIAGESSVALDVAARDQFGFSSSPMALEVMISAVSRMAHSSSATARRRRPSPVSAQRWSSSAITGPRSRCREMCTTRPLAATRRR
jgi:hypothetical protein